MNEIEYHLASVIFTRAVVGYLKEGDRVCLGIRKKVASGLGQNLIAGIGGKIGDSPDYSNETPDEAMDRESYEELGVEVLEKCDMGRVRFIFTHKPPDSQWNQDVQIYAITRWHGEPSETESTKPEWFDVGQIPWDRMWGDNEYWLPKVLSGKKVDGIFLYLNDDQIAGYQLKEVDSP